MHGQIVLGLFMILFNSNPAAHRERTKQKGRRKERKKHSSYNHCSPIITAPLQCSQVGCEQPMEERSTIGISKPNGFTSRGFPSHHSSGRCCT
jgi:hypothetical protein